MYKTNIAVSNKNVNPSVIYLINHKFLLNLSPIYGGSLIILIGLIAIYIDFFTNTDRFRI